MNAAEDDAVISNDAEDDDESSETRKPTRGGRSPGSGGRSSGGRGGRGGRGEKPSDGFTESVVQVSRVTKITKGGSQISFRATVVVGNGQGEVGVGCKKAKEVQIAVTKAAAAARKSTVNAPITKGATFPHRVTVKGKGGSVVMLRPAAPGTGVIAGGSCRTVLELAGYKNCFAKQLGSSNPLNNARAVVSGLGEMKTFKEVAKMRDMTLEELFSA
jgi:small subunit ribosomal protein S5